MKEYIIKIEEGKKDINGGMPLVEPAKELVRCKDCKHRYSGHCYNVNFGADVEEDWFCADGERRLNDETD